MVILCNDIRSLYNNIMSKLKQYTCIKCNKNFTKKTKINGKIVKVINKRKHCFDCVPYNTKFRITPLKGNKYKCKDCGINYVYGATSRRCTTKLCSKCCTYHKKERLLDKAIKYLDSRCQICGYSKHKEALTFHHIKSKKFEISRKLYRIGWASLKKELDKCILLCANCHAVKHKRIIRPIA